MLLPKDLRLWLSDESRAVIEKAVAANSRDALDPQERVLYELWLFDAEQSNGGVSQYFCNRGFPHWDKLSLLGIPALPSFSTFAAKVNAVVGRSDDPYMAVIESSTDLDSLYYEHRETLIRELQAVVWTNK